MPPLISTRSENTTITAAVARPDGSIAIESLARPELPEGGAIISVSACGLCGSDIDKLVNHKLPSHGVLGHEVVGVITELSAKAQQDFPHLSTGQRVALAHHVPCQTCHYCRHNSPSMCRTFKRSNITPGGFASQIAVTHEHLGHSVFTIPDSISDDAASAIEPLACCLRAVERIPENIGQTAVMVGMGFIGSLTSQALTQKGFAVYGLDLNAERLEQARSNQWILGGFTSASALSESLLSSAQLVDVVFLSVVSVQTIDAALSLVRDGGVIILFSSAADHARHLDQNQLYFREITVIPSYSPSIESLKQSAEMITSGQINADILATHHVTLENLQTGVELYRSGKAMKVVVTL